MKKTTFIATVLLGAAVVVRGQTPDPLAELLKPPPIDPALTNLPSFKPDGPIHEIPRGLMRQSTEPSVITKANQRLWVADFKIEMLYTSPTVSSLSVNVVLERKYKLEHLQSVHLIVREAAPKKEMIAMAENEMVVALDAKLFVPLWRRYMFEEKEDPEPEAAVYSSFILSRDLAKEAFLQLKCVAPATTGNGILSRFQGPTSVYLIDLNSFVPPPNSLPKPDEQREDGDDTININISL